LAFYRSKAQGEDAVKEAFADATIVKPGWMYGHEDRLYVSPRVEPAVYIVLSAVATSRTCTGAILV
jgi:NADH dehydrogenase (ubiquinone) 1 alpha subcomplex subunit 9